MWHWDSYPFNSRFTNSQDEFLYNQLHPIAIVQGHITCSIFLWDLLCLQSCWVFFDVTSCLFKPDVGCQNQLFSAHQLWSRSQNPTKIHQPFQMWRDLHLEDAAITFTTTSKKNLTPSSMFNTKQKNTPFFHAIHTLVLGVFSCCPLKPFPTFSPPWIKTHLSCRFPTVRFLRWSKRYFWMQQNPCKT